MNVLLADHAHRVVNIPATSIKSIIGVEHQEVPEDKAGSKTILRYDYGAGRFVAFLRTGPDQILRQITERTKDAPQPWLTLTTREGDPLHVLTGSIVAIHGMDPTAENSLGANARIDFYGFADGVGVQFALITETPEMIEEARTMVEQSIAEAARQAAPAPAPKRAAKPRRAATTKEK